MLALPIALKKRPATPVVLLIPSPTAATIQHGLRKTKQRALYRQVDRDDENDKNRKGIKSCPAPSDIKRLFPQPRLAGRLS